MRQRNSGKSEMQRKTAFAAFNLPADTDAFLSAQKYFVSLQRQIYDTVWL
jgi:hypothetical protein